MIIPKIHPLVYVIVGITILVADYIWLGFIARPMYDTLRLLLNPGTTKANLPYRIIPAAMAYLIMIVTLTILVIPNVITNAGLLARIKSAIWWGGLWGLAVYGTYDMTNLATINAFPTWIALADLLWGVVVGSLAAFTGSYVI